MTGQPLQVPTAFLSKASAVMHQPQPAKGTDNDGDFFIIIIPFQYVKEGNEFYTDSINLWHADQHFLP